MRSVTERQLKSVGPLFLKVTIELLRFNNVTFTLNSKSSDWFQQLLEIEKNFGEILNLSQIFNSCSGPLLTYLATKNKGSHSIFI